MRNKSILIIIACLILLALISMIVLKVCFKSPEKNDEKKDFNNIDNLNFVYSFRLDSDKVAFNNDNITLLYPVINIDNKAYVEINFFNNLFIKRTLLGNYFKNISGDFSEDWFNFFIVDMETDKVGEVVNNPLKNETEKELLKNDKIDLLYHIGNYMLNTLKLNYVIKENEGNKYCLVPIKELFEAFDYTVKVNDKTNEISTYLGPEYKYLKHINENRESGNWILPVVENRSAYNDKDIIEIKELINDPDIKLILITFWATWGEPCLQELNHYEKMYQKYKDQGVIFLAISIDTNEKCEEYINKSVKKLGLTYPILWDLENIVKKSYGISLIPVTYLIDKNNKIRYEHSGFTLEDVRNVEKALITMLDE